MRLVKCALIFLISPGSTAAKQEKLELDLPNDEDNLFWGRELGRQLQASSLQTEPTPTPVTQCQLAVSLRCTSGEGIPCDVYPGPEDGCVDDANFQFNITNTGSVTLDVTDISLIQSGGTMAGTSEANGAIQLVPGQRFPSPIVSIRFDWCMAQTYTLTVMVTADPGGCTATTTYVIEVGGTVSIQSGTPFMLRRRT